MNGNVLCPPSNPNLRCSECTPLFLQSYNLRNAGAVLHSHSLNAVLITNLFGTEFQCIDLEMIKGIQDHKNTEWLRVPIIENTEYLKNAILAHSRTFAIILRNQSIYIWGPLW